MSLYTVVLIGFGINIVLIIGGVLVLDRVICDNLNLVLRSINTQAAWLESRNQHIFKEITNLRDEVWMHGQRISALHASVGGAGILTERMVVQPDPPRRRT